jgi:hypothetical protein
MTSHARERALERLVCEAGLSAARAAELLARADAVARRRGGSLALRLLVLAARVGAAWSERSNGNEVWAVCRDGRVVTVMFRRSTQPATPGAFGVREVLL